MEMNGELVDDSLCCEVVAPLAEDVLLILQGWFITWQNSPTLREGL
jgi:hypothetical protein